MLKVHKMETLVFLNDPISNWGFPSSSTGKKKKKPPAMQETPVQFLSGEDPLEEGTHSSILAWRIPWTKEPSMLQSMGVQRIGHD